MRRRHSAPAAFFKGVGFFQAPRDHSLILPADASVVDMKEMASVAKAVCVRVVDTRRADAALREVCEPKFWEEPFPGYNALFPTSRKS